MEDEDGQDVGEVRMAGVCKVCQKAGKTNYLKVYQINFDEAITFCEDDMCTYPLGIEDPSDSIQKRSFTDIKNSPQRPQTPSIKKIPNSQPKFEPPIQSICLKFPPKEKPLAPYVVGKALGNGKSVSAKKTIETATRTTSFVTSNSVSNANAAASVPQNLQTDSIPKSNGDLSTQQNSPSDAVQNTNGGLKKTSPHSNLADSMQISEAGVNNVSKDSKQDYDSTLDGIFNKGSCVRSMLYPQWQNKDALCWLDVIMSLLVHSRHLQTIAAQSVQMSRENQSVLISLVKAYSQACKLINFSKKDAASSRKSESVTQSSNVCQAKASTTGIENDERKVVRDMENLSVKDKSVKTGAGLSFSSDFNDNMSFHMTEEYQKAFTILNDCRESLFQYLQPKLKCTKGQNDSPVFAIPLLVKGNHQMEELIKMKYSFQFDCNQCGFRKVDKYEISLPTFPNTVEDFQMSSPSFHRPCFKCSAPNQRRVMVYEKLSDVVLVHFVQGLPFNDLSALDFTFDGRRYSVTGLVQYRNDPDHFVTWIRDPTGTMWLEYDDLKSPVCQFKSMSLNVPASQFHIVMWEGSGKTSSKLLEFNGQTNSKLQSCSPSSVVSNKGNSGLEIKFPEVDRMTNDENNIAYEESMDIDPKDENLQSGIRNGHHIEKLKFDGLNVVKLKQRPKLKEGTGSDVKKTSSPGLMMVSFTPDGKLVPTSMLNFVNMANSNGQTRSLGDASTTNQVCSSHLPDDSLESKVANIKERQLKRTSSNDKPRFSSSQINLLRSLRTRKNSLVKDLEAESRHMEVPQRKQTLVRRNSGTKSSSPMVKTKNSSQYFQTNCPKKSVSHQDFSFQGQKFASYKMEREVQRQSLCSPVSELSDYSAPCSPAVSCHSDGVLFQKRKSDSCISYDKSEAYKGKKQRKSEDFSNVSETEKFMNDFLKDDDSLSTQNEIHKSNEECDVLKNLYSALNMELPLEESSSVEKGVMKTGKDMDDLPDVKNLASFIDDDTENSLDEFLAQL